MGGGVEISDDGKRGSDYSVTGQRVYAHARSHGPTFRRKLNGVAEAA